MCKLSQLLSGDKEQQGREAKDDENENRRTSPHDGVLAPPEPDFEWVADDGRGITWWRVPRSSGQEVRDRRRRMPTLHIRPRRPQSQICMALNKVPALILYAHRFSIVDNPERRLWLQNY